MLKTGDCVVRHAGVFTTGLGMVVSKEVIFKQFLFVLFLKKKVFAIVNFRVRFVIFVKVGFVMEDVV